MEFNPNNPVVRLCLRGMSLEEAGKLDEASKLFFQAWSEATDDSERFISAHYLARRQKAAADKLKWLEAALQLASKLNNDSVQSAFPPLHASIAKCHEELNDPIKAQKNYELAASSDDRPSDKGPFYHGTRATLRMGDVLTAGGASNYKPDLQMNHIYFTALPNGAGLAASLAKGDAPERIYVVEPTGKIENDPNVTNKRFPGNPTRSYRSEAPLKIIGEITDWVRQAPEELNKWREKLAISRGEIIN